MRVLYRSQACTPDRASPYVSVYMIVQTYIFVLLETKLTFFLVLAHCEDISLW